MSTQVLHYIDADPLDNVYFCKTMTALRSGPESVAKHQNLLDLWDIS